MKSEISMVILYTDGAARGNPGPASWGYILKGNTKILYQDTGFLKYATNNEAEYTAILKGLQKAQEMGFEEITVFSDSNLVINQLLRKYEINKRHLLKLFNDVLNVAGLFKECKFCITRRGDPDIQKVDALCNDCLDKNNNVNPINQLKKLLEETNSRYQKSLESSSFENNGRFIICLKIDSIRGILLSLRLETQKLLPDKGLFIQINGKKFKCENSSTPGWSKEITDDTGKIVDAKIFDWSLDREIPDQSKIWNFIFLGSELRCFLLGKDKGLPNWIETTQTLPGLNSHYLLVQKKRIPNIGAGYPMIFDLYTPVKLLGIPDEWTLYKNI
jgi:ribonuclease HI